jgi:Bacterial protein of unknown function (DUF903)
MKRIYLSIGVGVAIGLGCANQYVIKLNNGLQVTSVSKPKLKSGYYIYTDPAGKTLTVPVGRVREIEPASMAKEERDAFKPATSK